MAEHVFSRKLNKRTRNLLLVLTVMLLGVAITGVVWVERMLPYFSAEIDASAIELVPEDDEQPGQCVKVELEELTWSNQISPSASGSAISESVYEPKDNQVLIPGFEVYDENTLWSTETDVEIFKISYINGEGVVTVNSEREDNLLAPGTQNEYKFWLKNTGNVTVSYTMAAEAYFSNNEYPIPVEVRIKDYDGNYLLGGTEAWDDVLRLNEVTDTASLGPNSYANYTLEWQWPFELDDEYDTFLGNLAVEEDLTLTIVIRTIATAEYVKTGDQTNVNLWVIVMLIALSALIVLLVVYKKRRKIIEEE